jgi:acyl-CoA thioesterase FadM
MRKTDQMGIVYYANYSSGSRSARTDGCARPVDLPPDGAGRGFAPVIEAPRRVPAGGQYDDELEIRTKATLMTPVRIRFDYEIWRPEKRPLADRPHHPAPWTRTGALPPAYGRAGAADVYVTIVFQPGKPDF